MDGFLVVDKPQGATSHDMVSLVRRVTGIKKVGHTGTLDPFATGVLPVAIGDGTKAIQFLDESVKVYRAQLKLGVCTDTQDRTGKVLREREWEGVTPEELERVARAFLGKIMQLPPMFSALKRDGVPLYKLARRGEEVEREERPVEIHSITFDWIALPEASFTVSCSRGTYVRTLAHDIGEALGCGAHLVELRRLRSGLFAEEDALSAETLKTGGAPVLVPVERALSHLKEVALNEGGARKVANGVVPAAGDLESPAPELAPGEMVRLCSGERLAAVAQHDPRKGLRLARVFN
ncbi:tRNA pseudouridine(55) synthase TruB [Geomonas sp. RF6]|uniref:tRNA pseudouridine(55) synthase TruB n=1 Tax=Geomonas sp. RF6 TaxID=2897342 RepID=UPI001E2873D0|nr:tRNA pseudouridine(55) synthase TruB [Geomonas sp. RF6]UFS70844.1 tRNA pseudouridine(55) synthase TruB [Geomonas sp. RF6]